MEKLIITVSFTGNVPTRELTPHAPLTNDEIVTQAKSCVELGATVGHFHVRDSKLRPTCDRNAYIDLLNKLNSEDVKIIRQLSTGVRGGENDFETRGQMLDIGIGAEMASLATGSSNLPNTVNANSFELIQDLADKMYENNLKPEFEIFDMAMISNAIYLQKRGILKGPLHFNLVMHALGSIAGTPKNLMILVDALPPGSTWTVTGIGRSQVQMVTMAMAMGGHVRTGIEDVMVENGEHVTNEFLVQRIVNIANAMGRQIANVDEAREILGLR